MKKNDMFSWIRELLEALGQIRSTLGLNEVKHVGKTRRHRSKVNAKAQ